MTLMALTASDIFYYIIARRFVLLPVFERAAIKI